MNINRKSYKLFFEDKNYVSYLFFFRVNVENWSSCLAGVSAIEARLRLSWVTTLEMSVVSSKLIFGLRNYEKKEQTFNDALISLLK